MPKHKRPGKNKATVCPQLDLSFVNSASVITAKHDEVHLLMIGCGGTGSCLAPMVARIMRAIKASGKEVSALFIDPDHVEEKNVMRQNFYDAEVGHPKAQTLAARYSLAFGLNIQAVNSRFSANMVETEWDTLTVMIGCVDNAAARQELAQALHKKGRWTPPRLWWLDCGNSRETGQALLGSTSNPKALQEAFVFEKYCQHLPSPAWQCPTLLEPQPEERDNHNLSCAELASAGAQGMTVNQRAAVEAADMLDRLLRRRNLRRFATYFDQNSGSVKNYFITREQIGAFTAAPITADKK